MRYGLLTETFSTLRQKDLEMQGVSQRDLAGVLRLDLLLFNQIVIPDSHLFDGCVLLDTLRPANLADLSGHTAESPTVEVRLRAKTFDDSLRHYLVQDDGSFRPLEFRYLRDTVAERRIAEALPGATASSKGSEVRALREAMLRQGISEATVDSLNDGWAEWRAEGTRLGMFGTWQRSRFDLEDVMTEMTPVLSAIDAGVGSDLVSSIRDLVAAGDSRSASADRLLRAASGSESEAGIELVRDWYHDCRQIAIARQQSVNLAVRATAYTERLAQLLSERGPIANVADDQADSVRASIYCLASLNPGEFRDVYRETSANRRQFMAKKSHASLTQLVRQIVRLIGQTKPKSASPWFAQERILLPAATAGAGYLASGPLAAAATGVIGVGLHSGAQKLTEILGDRRETTSLVRWVASDHLVGGA